MASSGRLLQLLGLLQTGRAWSGSQLAARLGVAPRTVRRDVGRLRELGYPVEGELGAHGGYRLVAGAAMPPLLLDDDEAVAVAVALRTVAVVGIPGLADAGLRALAKLGQSLPPRLRPRVTALGSLAVGWDPGRAEVDVDVLAVLAAAASRGQRVRLEHEGRDGSTARRYVEPLRVVLQHRRWYLVAFDLDRDALRTFRVDRVREPRPTGARVRHELADDTVAGLMRRRALAAAPVARADVTLRLPRQDAAARLGDALGDGTLTDEDDGTRWVSAEDTVPWLVQRLLRLDCEFVVHGPPELVDHLRTVHERTAPPSAAEDGR